MRMDCGPDFAGFPQPGEPVATNPWSALADAAGQLAGGA
jgi:hypothetical protein